MLNQKQAECLQLKVKENTNVKRRCITTGIFKAVNMIDPVKQDRDWRKASNPAAVFLEKRKEKFQVKLLKNQMEQKKLKNLHVKANIVSYDKKNLEKTLRMISSNL